MKNKRMIFIITSVLTIIIVALVVIFVINNNISTPDVISVNGHKISYYDKFTIGDNLYNSIEVTDWIDSATKKSNSIGINSYGTTLVINICDSRITTYKGIKVGDNITKVNEKFKFVHFYTNNKYCTVSFKGSKEINNTSDYVDNEKIFNICYYYNDNNIITQIMLEEPWNQ